jgi:hypothetical protein
MNFVDSATDKLYRFSIGREESYGRFYLSIPVSNKLVDYEEYYEISKQIHDGYPDNMTQLAAFADACRRHESDHLLIVQPGLDRGIG